MTKRIQTYNDLLEEKHQLEVMLEAQKELIRYDVQQLKAEFEPAVKTFGLLGKMFTRDNTNIILNTGADTVIDLLVKKVLLGRAGWIPRLIVPYLLKNVSSHVIAEKKDTLLQKVFSWFRKNHNGKAPPDSNPASPRNQESNGTA